MTDAPKAKVCRTEEDALLAILNLDQSKDATQRMYARALKSLTIGFHRFMLEECSRANSKEDIVDLIICVQMVYANNLATMIHQFYRREDRAKIADTMMAELAKKAFHVLKTLEASDAAMVVPTEHEIEKMVKALSGQMPVPPKE